MALHDHQPAHRRCFMPTADAAILMSNHPLPPARPTTIGPILDPQHLNEPIKPWSSEVKTTFYPTAPVDAPAPIPEKPPDFKDRYLRAFLADNERLRLSMLWYYTRDILQEEEFHSGLEEKVHLAQEFTGWESAVVGIQDVNVYIRLATIGLKLAILPRGETICGHTVTQPHGSVFLMPNLLEDWRFKNSPWRESAGLRAYAGVPLRLQNEFGDCVSLGSLCVASSKLEEPLTKTQHQALVRLADWVISDLVQCARARRQREHRKMSELLSQAQKETDAAISEQPVLRILMTMYPDAVVTLQRDPEGFVKPPDHDPIPLSDFENNLWEDTVYLDEFIANSNHRCPPSTRVVRIIVAPCEILSGSALLLVASKDCQRVFDDLDIWFVQAGASMISEMWRKRLLVEAMTAKEKFLRGFSHQLRTPIHGILGSVDLLAEEVQSAGLSENAGPVSSVVTRPSAIDGQKMSSYLSIIKMAGQDLTSIVNNMINLNRWADIAMADRHCAMHTMGELETEIEHEILKITSGDSRYQTSVFMTHDLPPGGERFRTDLPVLCDSVLPLIVNAIQNTPEGIVSINIRIIADGGELVVDVQDTGRGIHPDHQKRIFEPYEKVDLHAPGAGLGLTLASRFATLLHGSVDLVSSDQSHGSHFRAAFPGIEYVCSPRPSTPLSSKFDKLPGKFFSMTTGAQSGLLCDYFSSLLMGQGFVASTTADDSFVVFGAVSDATEHQLHLSQIPSGQVAICLVPASEIEKYSELSVNNVLYASGLFSTSTLCSILEKAQALFLDVTTSQQRLLQTEEPLTLLMSKSNDPDTNQAPEIVSAPSADTPISQPTALSVRPSLTGPNPLTIQSHSPPTVLIVDDNVFNLRIMEMYCRKRGLPSRSATDGLQAIELFSRQQSRSAQGTESAIKLIFMDLQMPECDGIEATQQIRSLEHKNNWAKSFLMVMTGQDTPTDREAVAGAGADEYFVKPVVVRKLDQVMTEHFPGFKVHEN